MNPEIRIQQLVNDFVTSVSQLAREVAVETLSSALSSVEARTSAPSATTRRAGASSAKTRRPTRLRKGAKRGRGDIERLKTRFLYHVTANPGLRIEQINREIGTRTAELRLPLAKLIEAKEIKTKGHKRSTTYFPA